MRSQEVEELLRLIDFEPKQTVKKQNLFDNPAKVYLIIKTLFQNFKKAHELQLMQERIFEVKIKLNGDKVVPLTKVSAASIFREHSLLEEDINLLVQMKQYLKPEIKTQLYNQILNGISNLQNVGQLMKCYRSLLNLQFTNSNSTMYSLIQQKMVDKLINMDLKGSEFKIIAKNILALPIIKRPIIILISQLYQKVTQLKDFSQLYRIFQQNFQKEPQKEDLKALIKICLPETLEKIIQMVESGGQLSSKVLQIAQAQAKNKLQRMELVMTTKVRAILNFIVQVVKFGRPIWHQIIQWQHQAAQQPKNFLKNSLQGILIDLLRDKRFFETVLSIIQKITEIDQHSQIGLIFVRELLNLQNKQYLSHRIIRRFLAIKILKYNSSEEYLNQILGKGLKFIQVILQMFNFESNVVNFYHHIINNQQSIKLLEDYLRQLSNQMPVKFKQFFLKCNSTNHGQILTNINNPLFKILGQNINLQTAINLIRDLAIEEPSKCLITLFGKLLVVFKQSKQLSILKLNIVRSLNIILIRNSKQQLNSHFKVHLPGFIKEHLLQESKLIFQNVPEQTIEELKRFYDQFINKKKL